MDTPSPIQPCFHSFAYGSFVTWAPCYPLEETLRRLSAIGYPAVELGAARPHAWPWDLNLEERKTVQALLQDLNIVVAAICPISHNYNLASTIPQERNDAAEYYTECIKLAADLSCPVVVVVPGWRMYGTAYSQAWEWSRQGISRISKAAEDTGVILALEPITKAMVNLVNTTQQALEMIQQVESPVVKLMLDTAHMAMEKESPIDTVLEAGEYLVHVHVEDSDGRSMSRRPPGKGDFNWMGFIRSLRQVGYHGYLSAEMFGSDPDRAAYESLVGLQQLLSKY